MNNKQKIANLLLTIGMLILLVIAVLPLIGIMQPWFKYVYAIGAILIIIARIIERYHGKNPTLHRLYRIQAISAICYCISAAALFFTMNNFISEKDWLVFLTAGAVMQIYSSLRIQNEERKEIEKKQKN